HAERALLAIARAGHRDAAEAAAAGYGPEAVAAIGRLLDTDPAYLLPARMPVVPDWADPALLAPIELAGGAGSLPPRAAGHVLTVLALSRIGEPYAGLAAVTEACTRASLAEFAWSLFQRWQHAGTPAKESWALDALGLLGDDETVRRLAPVIRAWPGSGGHARAVAGLDVLAEIGTDVALMHLHGIAEKVKFRGLKDRAQEKIAEVAAGLGLSPERLADRLVPDFGLDPDGTLGLDYGPRQFRVGFDEQLRPFVTDAAGKRLRDLPKPGAKDDPALAPDAARRFAALKKDVRTIAADQIRRFERAMTGQRRWAPEEFERYIVGHPLVWHVARRLVWAAFDDAGAVLATLRVAEDRSLAGPDDEPAAIPDGARLGVAHPLQLGAAAVAWSEVFADYEILQPFPQLARDTHELDPVQRAATALTRFAGVKVPTTKVLGLERRGWRRGEPQDGGLQPVMERDLPSGDTLMLDLTPGIVVGDVATFGEQALGDAYVLPDAAHSWDRRRARRLGDVDAVAMSEIIRDLEEVTQ
ncbi:DUF4132 domain-containing protein, partial [Dactylosporangium sp. NPDC051485]|uniref:DUF4132 domain-containing protein n=1 Tax=Dactylosporangium sp. NPDC051485 TaxID=3154846 RepID=UPI003441008E